MKEDSRHKAIKHRIDNFTKNNNNKKPKYLSLNTSSAFNIAIELVAGIMVGLLIGLFFDYLFDSKPIFLILCLILSMVAVFKTIWNKYNKQNGS